MDLGRTRGKIKRQGRHSKSDNVEKVFWCGNSEETKKKGSVKMSKHKFSMKKKNRKTEKTQRNISPFQKNQKVETNEKYFFQKKKK